MIPSKPLLYHITAEKIVSGIHAGNLRVLPSIHRMMQEYGVSQYTMVKALRYLRGKKILNYSQGKRIMVRKIGRKEVSSEDLQFSTSRHAFFEKMNMRIRTGELRVGEVLPKLLYFSVNEHISSATICDAFTMLQKEGLIHKQGKKWIVGPTQDRLEKVNTIRTSSSEIPTVLLLFASYKDWFYAMNVSNFIQPFVNMFYYELKKNKMQFLLALMDNDNQKRTNFPTGKKEILSRIGSLGENYLGSCVVGDQNNYGELKELLVWLLGFGKRVCWFNPTSNRDLIRKNIPNKNYFRCSINESKAVALVVDNLIELQHSTYAFPMLYYGSHDTFSERRRQLIKEKTVQKNQSTRFLGTTLKEEFWHEKLHEYSEHTANYMMDRIALLREKISKKYPQNNELFLRQVLKKELLRLSPSIIDLLCQNDVTAIIAPNQRIAINYYYYFINIGLSLPRDISLVTFDNYSNQSCFPITTIDWKLDDLGYKAAHIFIGDIPIKTDRYGDFSTLPMLVDCGSLGPPRKGKLVLDKNIRQV